MFSTESYAAPDTMFWGGAKGGKNSGNNSGKRKTVRKPAGQSKQKKPDKKDRSGNKQLEKKRQSDEPDEEDESFPKFYQPGSHPTLAEVASGADASAIHHVDPTQVL